MIPNTPECFASHLGVWAIEPSFGRSHFAAIRNGNIVSAREKLDTQLADLVTDVNGIRVIPITGTMMRAPSKFGGTSTVQVRREISKANADESVNGILLLMDTPGGHADGTDELADAVASSRKEIRSFVPSISASAGYWAMAHSSEIAVSRSAMVGSIGTFTVLQDVTGALEEDGIQLHLVSSGGVKGHGADGKVTPELLEETQKRVDFVDSFFAESVASGRKLDADGLAAVHNGKMFTPAEAKELNLIDSVDTYENFLNRFIADAAPKKSRTRMAEASIRLAKSR